MESSATMQKSLLDLPWEMVDMIIRRLDHASIMNARSICRDLDTMITHPSFWLRKLETESVSDSKMYHEIRKITKDWSWRKLATLFNLVNNKLADKEMQGKSYGINNGWILLPSDDDSSRLVDASEEDIPYYSYFDMENTYMSAIQIVYLRDQFNFDPDQFKDYQLVVYYSTEVSKLEEVDAAFKYDITQWDRNSNDLGSWCSDTINVDECNRWKKVRAVVPLEFGVDRIIIYHFFPICGLATRVRFANTCIRIVFLENGKKNNTITIEITRSD